MKLKYYAFLILLVSSGMNVPALRAQQDSVSIVHPYPLILSDTMLTEMASFSTTITIDSAHQVRGLKLRGFSPRSCSDRYAYFETGDIWNSDFIINITGSAEPAKCNIEEFHLEFRRYHLLDIPKEAFADIVQPRFCSAFTKKNKPISRLCRVFWSSDERRLYICMRAGTDTQPQEVIWIIKDREYYGRAVS
jgi:hypothetical protein